MAYSLQPKKMLALNLLELLRKYSDENHRLSQQELLRLLESEYGMTADRKSVRRNLLELQACGYPVCCDERPRAGADGEDGTFCTGWYIERAFTDAELRLLIDSLLSSRSLPESQCASLIRKIEDLSSVHFRSRLTHVRALPGALPRSDQFFYTVEILDEAITSKKQVSFAYCEYGVDKKPHPRTDGDGRVRRYVVNPYQMVAANGRYYLICNYDKYDTLANYRIDRISGIELLDTPGVLWPKFDDPDVGLRLAFIGSVKDTILDIELIAARFLTIMNENYPERIKERYKLEFPPESEEFERLEMLARKRGMLISGGEPDTERAAVMLLDEYRAGKLGRITLD